MSTVGLWISRKARRVDHGKAGFMPGLLLIGPDNKHVAGKCTVPGKLVDDPDRQTAVGVSAGKAILNKPFFALKVIGHPGKQRIKMLGAVGYVDLAPPDLVFRVLVAYDKLVIGRATGMLSGIDGHRSGSGQKTLALADGMFGEGGLGQVPVHGFGIAKAVVVKAISAVGFGVGHGCSFVITPSSICLIERRGLSCYGHRSGSEPLPGAIVRRHSAIAGSGNAGPQTALARSSGILVMSGGPLSRGTLR